MSAPGVRLGIVGCGRLAEQAYVPAVAFVDRLEIVAVADPDPVRRRHVAALAGGANGPCAAFDGAASLVAGADVDAVVVASPARAHVADATAAAEAGLRALIEKPPAPDAAAAAGLAALEPAPRFGFNRRFDRGARSVGRRIPTTGDLDLRLEISYRRRSWRAVAVADDALLDLGPHLVDWARWLTGCSVLSVTDATVAHDHASFGLELARGRARVVAATDRLYHERIDVRAAGRRVARHRVARYRVGGPVGAVLGRMSRGPHPLVLTITAQLEAFARLVRSGESGDLGTVDDAIETMAVLDAVRASAAADGATVLVHERPMREGVET